MKLFLSILVLATSIISNAAPTEGFKLNCTYQFIDLKTGEEVEDSKVFDIVSYQYSYALRDIPGSKITIFTTAVEHEIAIAIHDQNSRVTSASTGQVISLQAYPINNSEYDVECTKEK